MGFLNKQLTHARLCMQRWEANPGFKKCATSLRKMPVTRRCMLSDDALWGDGPDYVYFCHCGDYKEEILRFVMKSSVFTERIPDYVEQSLIGRRQTNMEDNADLL